MKTKILTLAAAVAVLAGCSASGGTGTLPGAGPMQTSGTETGRGRSRVTFTIKVPRREHSSHYVSPSTRSISIVVDPGTAHQATVATNLSVGVTSVALDLAVGNHVFNIATYDGAISGGAPTGHLLSVENSLAFTVVEGRANVVGATLQGVPAAIVVTAVQSQDVTGDQADGFDFVGADKADGATSFPRTFSIATQDADGNFIVGAGAPQIAAVSSNASVVGNGVASAASSFAFTPGSNATFPASATVTITATPGSGAGAAIHTSIGVTVTCAQAPRIYLWNTSTKKMVAYDEEGDAVTLPGTAFSSLSGISALTYDPNDNLLYTSDGAYVYAYDLNGNKKYTVDPSPTNFISALGYGNGFIYGAGLDVPGSGGVSVFNEQLAQQSVSGNWHETASGAVPGLPVGLVVDTGGDVDILDAAAASLGVQRYTPQGAAVGTQWTPIHNGQYGGLTQDPVTGYFYVTDSTSAVQVFTQDGDRVNASGAFSGLTQAGYLQWDVTSRRLYVYDATLGKLFAFDGSGNAIATPGGFPGLSPATFMAIAL